MHLFKHLALLSLMTLSLVAWSEDEKLPPDVAAKVKQFEDSLQWQQGSVTLHNGLAKLEVPKEFRYLKHADAVRVLELWGNHNIGDTLGMIFPADVSPFSKEAWAVVMTYEEDGHIKDDDAKSINYDDLLKEMQAAMKKANEEREDKKLPQVELLGWAAPPNYDPATHKMYWAKELRFGGSKIDTLNYNIRVLGKEGVMNLNIVAGMNQLKMIQDQAPHILAFTDFTTGNRYEDFQPGVHKVAGYGLAGLVAGGVLAGTAAKLGMFKFLIPILVALKKFILLIVVGAMGAIKTFFRRLRGKGAPAPAARTATAGGGGGAGGAGTGDTGAAGGTPDTVDSGSNTPKMT